MGSAAPLLRLLCRNHPLHMPAQGAGPVPSLSPPPVSPQRCPHPSDPKGGWVGGVSAGNDNIQRAWEDLGPLREGPEDSLERMGWVGDRTQSVSRHKASSAGRTQSIREQAALQQDSNGLGLPGQEDANLGYGIGVRGERGREPACRVTIPNPVDGERLDFQGQQGGEEGLGLRGEEKAERTRLGTVGRWVWGVQTEPQVSGLGPGGWCAHSVASVVSDSATPRPVAHQAPLSTGFPRQEHWSGWPCPPPGDLPDPEIKPRAPVSPPALRGWGVRRQDSGRGKL